MVNVFDFMFQFQVWVDLQMLILVQGEFIFLLLDNCWLVIVVIDDEMVNQQVSEVVEVWCIFCNVVDVLCQVSFIMLLIIDCLLLMVVVFLGGILLVLVCLLCEKLELILFLYFGQLVCYVGYLCVWVKQQFVIVGECCCFWEKLFVNDCLVQLLVNDDWQVVVDIIEQLLMELLEYCGEVVLVGVGFGDVGLFMFKGLQQIQQVDVVVYDWLVFDDIMNLVCCDVDWVFVGKCLGYYCVLQEEINQILLCEV